MFIYNASQVTITTVYRYERNMQLSHWQQKLKKNISYYLHA